MKALVIVESPAKSKTIEKYLGKGYKVQASKGHIVDLPKSGLGVDVEKNYEPKYEISGKRARKTIKQLKQEAEKADKVILAVDPDREGEAIGWHVANRLGFITLKGNKKKTSKPLERIVFTEITKDAVKNALKKPRNLSKSLFNAQQARRVLDRLVGYKLSPLLWKKIQYGLSAGRVQSVAVKFIVDREREREKFVAEEYWKVFAFLGINKSKMQKNENIKISIIKKDDEKDLPKQKDSQIKFELATINKKKASFENLKDFEKVLPKFTKQIWKISSIKLKKTKRYPKPPFTTSTLQQTAANWFGFSSKKTMTLAQKLYEQGLITYMRTDSTNMSKQAVQESRRVITQIYGKDYVPEKPKYYKTKAKVAQEAHEAIRPTNFKTQKQDIKFDKDAKKLYELIWQRALASQCKEARIEKASLIINLEVDGKDFEFRANGQRILFKGFLAIYPEKVSENILPELQKDDELFLEELFATQHFTQPPARFSEASLIKQLENYGIGRPSTYAPIISTIQSRKYVIKENKYFIPTDRARVVVDLLHDHFSQIVDKDFTAKMEKNLDEIANGDLDWKEFLDEFYKPFEKKLKKKDKEISRDKYTVLGKAPKNIKCPDCGGEMIIKLSRYGKFYSCKKFPDCKGMMDIDGTTKEDIEKKVKTEKFKQTYKKAPKTDDGRDYILKKGRFGEFWAHPDYPKVKDAKPLQYKKNKLLELFGKPPETEEGEEYVFRSGKFGPFWAHPDYPKVKKTVKIKKKK